MIAVVTWSGCRGEPQPEAVVAVEELSSSLHDTFRSMVVAEWTQLEPGPTWVEFRVGDEAWRRSPARELAPGPQQELLLGVPYGVDVEWRVVVEAGRAPSRSEPQTATTEDLPEPLAHADVLAADAAAWEPAGEFLYTSLWWTDGPHVGSCWQLVLDRQGRVVWLMPLPSDAITYYAGLSRDGTRLVWDQTLLFDPFDSTVQRSTLDGVVERTWSTPGLLHAFTELGDDDLLFGSYAKDFLFETLEHVTADGEQLWECEGFERDQGSTHTECRSNSLFWDQERDVLLNSFFTSMTVIEQDRATGRVLESWGQLSDWTFDPPGSQFDWQHGVTFTDRGTLLLSTHVDPDHTEGVAREFELDRQQKVLRQIWTFGQGEGIDAVEYGEARRLPNGDTLQNFGTTPRVREIGADGEVVWDVTWYADAEEYVPATIGRSVWLPDLYTLVQ
jgi:hypothetical protein